MSIDINVTITQGGSPPVTIQSTASNPVTITGGETIAVGLTSAPAGATGPAGPQGPAGPAGPTGPAGSSTIAGCTDAQITQPKEGQVLRYGPTLKVENKQLLVKGGFY